MYVGGMVGLHVHVLYMQSATLWPLHTLTCTGQPRFVTGLTS